MPARTLPDYLEATAARLPDRPAVVDPAGWSISYADLNRQADAVASWLVAHGVLPGDRVGIVLPKSVAAVTVLFGVMKAGAAYVPVDHNAPAERGRRILADCKVRAVVVDSRSLSMVPDENDQRPLVLFADGEPQPYAEPMTPLGVAFAFDGPSAPVSRAATDLAYILYTSGSTGIPKGVMLTHENAVSFVDWCSAVFDPSENDRFSSHAPFHFDLSVLDIYVSVKHGATLYLISDALGKDPRGLAAFVATNRLTVWYSTPSILTLLTQFGQLEHYEYPSLRLVLFAGEVFPVKHLREIKRHWPEPAYYNLYGPTETNVCTFARIPRVVPDDRDTPYPIGYLCAHCEGLVLDSQGAEVPPGDEGLLYISGASVFTGYWNRPVENAAAFHDIDGVRWYNTGDVVRWHEADGYIYVGRRDRMVKRRGYRIELGEIERALYKHPRVREAAVVAMPDPESGIRITAFLSCEDGPVPSVIELKTFCAAHLPSYMSPDRLVASSRLPRTSTDKIDYQALRARLTQGAAT